MNRNNRMNRHMNKINREGEKSNAGGSIITDGILTEGGDYITTEGGDHVTQEGA